MTSKDLFDDTFPQDKQIGGSHYKDDEHSAIRIYFKK